MKIITLIWLILIITFGLVLYKIESNKPLFWNWQSINIDKPETFPPNFLWGVGTSALQVEGNTTNSTWTLWENSIDQTGKKRIEHSAGNAANQWNLYKQDIALLKQLGVDAYRFSIEWSKIEPQEGVFDETALNHYKDLCEELLKNNIKPCVTLHHYVDPIWFAKKQGFEKAENSKYFIRYAEKVFEVLHDKVYMWFTFNAADRYAWHGYYTGKLYPGKQDVQLCAQVYAQLLNTHVILYHSLKQKYKDARIGIIKNILQFDPWNKYNPLDIYGSFFNRELADNGFFSFFSTGTFKIHIPFKVNYTFTNLQAKGALDFIGINYYSHVYTKGTQIVPDSNELQTDNPNYTIYPEGLYRAIQEVSNRLTGSLNIPIYITENGIATDDDNLRELYIKRYLYALHKGAQQYNVQGYFYWSFIDLYEWGNFTKHYGLYAVDLKTQQRTLRPGSSFYIETIRASHE